MCLSLFALWNDAVACMASTASGGGILVRTYNLGPYIAQQTDLLETSKKKGFSMISWRS